LFGSTFSAAATPIASHPTATHEERDLAIPPEQELLILRYFHAEHWRIGTIAQQLGLHHGTVERVLNQAGVPRSAFRLRPSRLEPYLPFIRATLEKFPTLTATRLFAMVQARGYRGGVDHFRHLISAHRPRPHAEAYLRLRTLPGEQTQIDWGHFGHLAIGRARRPLMAFVMVLSYSRQIYLRFFLDARMENFLRGHIGAFEAWQGVPRIALYDNLKSAVLERQGSAIRFHPTLLDFAGHYRYEPRPVAVARGNEKGRVERAIRYVRGSFFAARTYTDLADLNAQAALWCTTQAAERQCPEDPTQRVHEVFAREQPLLLPLPGNPYPSEERVAVQARKTPYVRFDLNDYSIPHTHVQRPLTVVADLDQVRILDGAQVLASHPRSYDKRAQVEVTAHVAALVAHKRQARQHRGIDRLAQAAPASQALLTAAAVRGDNLGTITAALLRLLERYGAAPLNLAIADALQRGVPHPNAVRLALERQREAAQQPPPIAIPMPEHVRRRDIPVQPTRLDAYDQLTENTDEPS
jgi:transposase